MTRHDIEIKRGGAAGPTPPVESPWAYRADLDISEAEDGYTVWADVPGSSAGAIEVACEDGALTLRAPVSRATPAGRELLVQEYGIGDFQRTIHLGASIDAAAVSAQYQNGVLTVHLPKSARSRPHHVKVKGA
jgi:HSP20 family protein